MFLLRKSVFLKCGARWLRVIVALLSVILLMVCLGGCGSSVLDVTNGIVDLGVPYKEQYPAVEAGDQSRVPWDMKLYDGKLYVSAGNYNDNTGPIGLCWYDTANDTWTTNGYPIAEEQIHAFREVDGVLTIPGCDACFDSGYANYYQLKEGEWEQYAAFPNARHNFDILRFENNIFAAIGADPGFSPLLISKDNGASFEQVPLSMNGSVIETSLYDMVRCYFLFEHKNELYALVVLKIEGEGRTHLIAKYEDEKQGFSVIGDFNSITPTGTALGMKHTFFTEAVTWKGQAYFTNGKLIRFADEKLELTGRLNKSIVWDLLVYEDCLYLLTSTQKGSTVTTTVYCTDDGTGFESVLSFKSSMAAVSFEMDSDNFYFGMADTLHPESEKTGSVFMVERF